jgi:hypothetical protein
MRENQNLFWEAYLDLQVEAWQAEADGTDPERPVPTLHNLEITPVIHSPGTTRHTPPPLPEDVKGLALLMGVKFIWSAKKKLYYAAVSETPDTPEQLFSIDPYVAQTDDQWMESMKFIADHIKEIKTGAVDTATLPPTGRKVFEDYIVSRVQEEADNTAPEESTEEKQENTNDQGNQ